MKQGAFRRWVMERGGSRALSQRLGITPHAVNAWLRREVTPNTELAVRLVRLGHGAFTHDDIVRETYSKRVREARALKYGSK